MRSLTGTKSAPPGFVTLSTKSMIDLLAASLFQEGNGSGAADWAPANWAQISRSTRLTILAALSFIDSVGLQIQDIEQLLTRKSLGFGIFGLLRRSGLHV